MIKKVRLRKILIGTTMLCSLSTFETVADDYLSVSDIIKTYETPGYTEIIQVTQVGGINTGAGYTSPNYSYDSSTSTVTFRAESLETGNYVDGGRFISLYTWPIGFYLQSSTDIYEPSPQPDSYSLIAPNGALIPALTSLTVPNNCTLYTNISNRKGLTCNNGSLGFEVVWANLDFNTLMPDVYDSYNFNTGSISYVLYDGQTARSVGSGPGYTLYLRRVRAHTTINLQTENEVNFGDLVQAGLTSSVEKDFTLTPVIDGQSVTIPSGLASAYYYSLSSPSCSGASLSLYLNDGTQWLSADAHAVDANNLMNDITARWTTPGNCTSGSDSSTLKFTIQWI
ncbi:hypothetical protein R3X26_15775 [Vibrio sp. TH_r3]|uniref:hypothetical protein n=1 Tax=Vibrio sp. TH_r3 TaxID=3082084 RepID=UPI0029550B94|nr:hypothetical protein [Vibrio sp. TH_r3]MDV7105864.1 hypothetical protein [Vibrio sp. TH_r3]